MSGILHPAYRAIPLPPPIISEPVGKPYGSSDEARADLLLWERRERASPPDYATPEVLQYLHRTDLHWRLLSGR